MNLIPIILIIPICLKKGSDTSLLSLCIHLFIFLFIKCYTLIDEDHFTLQPPWIEYSPTFFMTTVIHHWLPIPLFLFLVFIYCLFLQRFNYYLGNSSSTTTTTTSTTGGIINHDHILNE